MTTIGPRIPQPTTRIAPPKQQPKCEEKSTTPKSETTPNENVTYSENTPNTNTNTYYAPSIRASIGPARELRPGEFYEDGHSVYVNNGGIIYRFNDNGNITTFGPANNGGQGGKE